VLRITVCLLVVVSACASAPASMSAKIPADAEAALGAAGYARVVCAAVFVAGRAPEDAAKTSTAFVVNEVHRAAAHDLQVDRAAQTVRVTVGGETGVAHVNGDQGCVVGPPSVPATAPAPVRSALPPGDGVPWPMGTGPDPYPVPAGVNRTALAAAVALAFADSHAMTQAVLVVHRGRLVAERYAPGVGPASLLDASAMGKSALATLLGVLVGEGRLTPEAPAPIAVWRAPGDPRGGIRVLDLMQMSSGLRCSSPFDEGYQPSQGYTDSQRVYTAGIDAVAFAESRPAAAPPGTVGHYANCDPLVLTGILRRTVEARGETVAAWAQRALFDRIGVRRFVVEQDPFGNPLFIGSVWASARDWARLGLLYLQDGVWQGQRVLPAGWAAQVRTPAPAWKPPDYGALFWLDGEHEMPLPPDVFLMAGVGLNNTFIVPSRELVIVRMGHTLGGRAFVKIRAEMLKGIVGAIETR
jgi:CubicO group peptidase (beta-lactamase class C family)